MASYTDNNYGCKWKPRKVSAKRDFPDAFYDVINVSSGNQLVKKHKVCESCNDHVGPDEGVLDFIPLETETEKESVSTGSCGSGTPGSGYDIIPRIVSTGTRGSGEGMGKLGDYTDVRFHGVCIKEIRWCETEDGLKIELSVDKLMENRNIDDESDTDRVRNERVKRYEEVCSRRRPVSAIRSYPRGCGPVKKVHRRK